MFQKTADYGQHPNIFGFAGDAGQKTADASNNHHNMNAGVRGLGKLVHQIAFGDGIAFQEDARIFAVFDPQNLAINQRQQHRLNARRGNA